jgi:hypothetical protein
MTDIERIEEQIALALATRGFTADHNGAVAVLSALRAMPLDLRLALADELAPWEPIEKAADGDVALVYSGFDREPYRSRMSVRKLRKGAGADDPVDWYDHLGCRDPLLAATHFKPLPARPQQKDPAHD